MNTVGSIVQLTEDKQRNAKTTLLSSQKEEKVATPVVRSDKLGMAICNALGIDHLGARRIIIDCQAGCLAMAYIETYASEKMLDLNWSKGLEGAKIEILEKQHGDTTGSSQGGLEGRTE